MYRRVAYVALGLMMAWVLSMSGGASWQFEVWGCPGAMERVASASAVRLTEIDLLPVMVQVDLTR